MIFNPIRIIIAIILLIVYELHHRRLKEKADIDELVDIHNSTISQQRAVLTLMSTVHKMIEDSDHRSTPKDQDLIIQTSDIGSGWYERSYPAPVGVSVKPEDTDSEHDPYIPPPTYCGSPASWRKLVEHELESRDNK